MTFEGISVTFHCYYNRLTIDQWATMFVSSTVATCLRALHGKDRRLHNPFLPCYAMLDMQHGMRSTCSLRYSLPERNSRPNLHHSRLRHDRFHVSIFRSLTLVHIEEQETLMTRALKYHTFSVSHIFQPFLTQHLVLVTHFNYFSH